MVTVELCCKLEAEPLKLGAQHWSSTNAKATGEGEGNSYPRARATTPTAHGDLSKKRTFVCVFVK